MSGTDILVSAALGGAGALGATLAASAVPGLRLATRRALVVAGLLVAALAPAVAIAASSLGLGLRPVPGPIKHAASAPRAGVAARPGPVLAAAPDGDPGRGAPATGSSASVADIRPTSGSVPPRLPLPVLLSWLWLAGTAVGLLGLAFGLLRLRRLRRSLVASRQPRLDGLFVSDALAVPATIGFLSPVVAIPSGLARDLSDEELAAVRRHEGSHVARRDPLAGLLGRLACAVQWPNPLSHLAARRLEALSEALADAEAVRARPEEGPRYAACLVRIAERACAMREAVGAQGILGRRQALTRRIEALLDPRGLGDPRPTWGGRIGVVSLGLCSAALAACCCRAPEPPAPHPRPPPVLRAPAVVGFSPLASAADPATGWSSPTYTNSSLTVNTHPAFPGKIVVFFRPGTRLDPASIFLGGSQALGVDLAALQILQYIPGTGNTPLPPARGGVEIRDDAIVFTPAEVPLAYGQYSIAIFAKVRGIGGAPLEAGPVFHSFTVGAADTIAPTLVTTLPVNGASRVGAGVHPPAVAGVTLAGSASPDIVIRFSEPISAASVSRYAIQVVDAVVVPGGGAPPMISPAPGFPRLQSNGFEIAWRGAPEEGGLPFGTQVEVTVVGSDGGVNAAPITDTSGNALPRSYVFRFRTNAPPDLPAPSGR